MTKKAKDDRMNSHNGRIMELVWEYRKISFSDGAEKVV